MYDAIEGAADILFTDAGTVSHATALYNCLDLQNAMVPSTVLLASYNTDASNSTSTCTKSHVIPLNNHLNMIMQ